MEKDIVGKVLSFTDLLKYQEGSIVSRTILDKTAGTVTLFAFDEGQALSEHTAPFDALINIIDGEAEVTISGKSHQLRGVNQSLCLSTNPMPSELLRNLRWF